MRSIVYNLWAGYFRGGDASFMGLNRHSGWRGGRRLLRELGHGTYLAWMIVQVKNQCMDLKVSSKETHNDRSLEVLQKNSA